MASHDVNAIPPSTQTRNGVGVGETDDRWAEHDTPHCADRARLQRNILIPAPARGSSSSSSDQTPASQ
jgi:hypothetical protein